MALRASGKDECTSTGPSLLILQLVPSVLLPERAPGNRPSRTAWKDWRGAANEISTDGIFHIILQKKMVRDIRPHNTRY